MLIRMSEWEQIRDHFSQDEKDALNLAVVGESICPRGLTIDTNKLPDALGIKLVELLPFDWKKKRAGDA